ncbi:MAG: DUF3343 domain-containing protein [Clostridium sp.]|nr:DUF3343 domain-containing protein [Clostridium sp.]
MEYYYVGLMSRSYAFFLERRMKNEGMKSSEITFMPREIMTDSCNMGVRFKDSELPQAAGVLRTSGFPGIRVFREITRPDRHYYHEVTL